MAKWLYLYLILYCILHSILADEKITGSVYNSWWYRFFYVCQSVILLLPLMYLYINIPHKPFFSPAFPVKILLGIVWTGGLGFGLYAANSYDNSSFLGISQIKAWYKGEKQPEKPKVLKTDGALAVVRHPYYTAGLILIWSRPMNSTDFIITLILTAYFILGYLNEERKLIMEFKDDYLDYRKRVPALIPRFWREK